ncbi:hypothetical protein [Candidatus Leptofilum sp.]|uniref:hypothetical protein n=1 Tax=Candidatus Leptofilum sp. TaxID=3241576 RepID=UPI003B58B796
MSVGHVARVFEAAGLPTITIAVAAFAGRLEPMQVPRLLLTPFLMGRPLGQPNDDETQRDVLRTGLRLLETAVATPTVAHY